MHRQVRARQEDKEAIAVHMGERTWECGPGKSSVPNSGTYRRQAPDGDRS